LPTVLRLSDEAETALNLASPTDPSATSGGCLLLVGYEGDADAVATRRGRVGQVLTDRGGVTLGDEPGRTWVSGRFAGPYLRDSLLDCGVLVETVETATFWSGVAALYAGVKRALEVSLGADGSPVLVLCHISHVYETGCSLYFTVVARAGEEPIAQWAAAKEAASHAITVARATITHHHGVSRDHTRWLTNEIGPVGIRILRAVKDELDPRGVMNPGVLLP